MDTRKILWVMFFCFFLGSGTLSLSAQNNAQTSIAMLNYLATEASVISSSQDNRLALENIYNKLINNSNPDVIDETTLDFYQVLLDIIHSFRMITYQRERLQFLFNNQQAQAITQAMPNPLYLLGARDKRPLALIATATAMVMDSAFKYQGAMNDAKLAYLEGDWKLDDAQSDVLHTLASRSFVYRVNITNQYRLSGSDSLSEENIRNFVTISLWDAAPRKRQALEANRRLYARYAPYWLELGETYYELGMYRECLDAVLEYENVQAHIFLQDKDFARLLPKAIVATGHVHGDGAAYVNLVTRYLRTLVDNTSDDDWQLRYFAAQAYISLASTSNRNRNLQAAYDLLLNNVRVLSVEHEKTLNEYFSPLTTVPPSLLAALDDAQKKLSQAKIDRDTMMNRRNATIGREERTQLENKVKEAENKVKEWERKITAFKNARERELPPFSQALWVNYVLLESLFEPLNKNDNDKAYVRQIIDNAFWHLDMIEEERQGISSWRSYMNEEGLKKMLDSDSIEASFLSEFNNQFTYSRRGFSISSTSPSSIFDAIFGRNDNRRFVLGGPDFSFTALNSIDVKIYNADNNTVLYDEKKVRWDAISIERGLLSGFIFSFNNIFPKWVITRIGINLNTTPTFRRNEAYKMEIFIKNIDEQGSYNSRLHFTMPLGKTSWSDWVFDYVE